MSNKSFESYNKIFQEILNLLDEYKIKINFKNIIINCDFEKSLIKAINTEFSKSKLWLLFPLRKSLMEKGKNFRVNKI